jgi:hypothetical protein
MGMASFLEVEKSAIMALHMAVLYAKGHGGNPDHLVMKFVDTAEVVASPRRSREEQADVFPSLTSSAGQRKFHDASPSLVGIATKQTLIPGMHLQGSRLLPPGKHDGSLVQLNESKTVQARPKI